MSIVLYITHLSTLFKKLFTFTPVKCYWIIGLNQSSSLQDVMSWRSFIMYDEIFPFSSSYLALKSYESLHLHYEHLPAVSIDRPLLPMKYSTFLQISLNTIPPTIPGSTSVYFHLVNYWRYVLVFYLYPFYSCD